MSVRTLISGVLLVLSALVVPAQASWQEASTVIDGTTRDMLAVVENEQLKQPEQLAQLMGEIERVIEPVVDFPYIARQVMGKYYRRATPEELERFSGVFKTTLLRTYAKAIVGFEFQSYEIEPPRAESPEPDKQVVTVKVKSGNGTVYNLVNYMLKQGDRWTLVNVMVDGVNLRLTFRNQFADMYERNNSVTGVIDSWESQVAVDLDKGVRGGEGSEG